MMKLELKESNSPFWLLGLSNGKITTGSFTNVPCYYKSSKKQYELATKIIKEAGIDEVYLITGIVWDNMKGSWSVKEAGSYVQNKGRLIISKNETTSYEEKYNESLKEDKYPKGVSREPLPKDGVKVYTSPATTLEGKGDENDMKLELNDDKLIKEELTSVDDISEDLQDRFFTTMSDGRPEMFKKFTKDELQLFADFVKQLPEEEITDLERSMVLVAISLAHGDNLTIDDEYIVAKESNQYTKDFGLGDTVKFIHPGDELSDETAMIVGYDEDGFYKVKWSDGNVSSGLHDKNLKLISKSDLKESKIVSPIGNPQTASSFVNIDVDLDHMEVSDFIVRLAQAIRSEQTSVLEYVALRSANGITNEERANIDAIIEEEKNHMVAFTTMLYKQLLTNHKQNVDGANEEFTLPTFGTEIFDNLEDGKLTESIASTIEKLAVKEAGIRMSDEYFIGNNEDGRMYHGLGAAMNVIKNAISTSGEQVVVQNVTLADSKNEDVKLEDTFNSIDELINELKTDTNYDELAYHIHEYAKTNKARALELMDKLFELERDKSPEECRDAIIADLEEENNQYKTEETKISLDGETMSQTQWDVVVDVDYDEDFHVQVLNNLTNAIEAMNKISISEHYGIATDKYTLGAGKFNFVVITTNAFTGNINEEFVADICDRLFEKASTYEYFIKRA